MWRNFFIVALTISLALRAKAQGFVWTSQIGISTAVAAKVSVDASTNVYVVGGFYGTANFGKTNLVSAGDVDIFFAKYDSRGNLIWVKQAGGNGTDVAQDIAVDQSGNIFVLGYFQGTAAFDSSNLTAVGSISMGPVDNLFIAKYSPDGTLSWISQAGGPGGGAGLGISVGNDENIYSTGFSKDFNGWYSITIDKWDSSGTPVWHRQISGLPNYGFPLQGNGIKVSGSGDVYVTGKFATVVTMGTNTLSTPANFGDAIFIARLDADGNFVWAQQPTSSDATVFDNGAALAVDSAGDVLVTGSYSGSVSLGTNQLPTVDGQTAEGFITKCKPDGTFVWARQFGGNGSGGVSVAADSETNFYVSGWTSPSQILIDKFDSNGNVLWGLYPNHNAYSGSYGTAVDNSNRAYLVSWASGSGSFDAVSFTNIGGNDLFVSQVSEHIPPVFTRQPVGAPFGFKLGGDITFFADTRSLYPVSYRWLHNGAEVPGATNTTLSILDAQLVDQGNYFVIATNIYGASTSIVANLTIYFNLALRSAGSGTAYVSPLNTNTFAAAESLSLHAVASTGYAFTGWTGDAVGTNNPLSFPITSNMTITASFSDSLTNIVIDNRDANSAFVGSWITRSDLSGAYAADFAGASSASSATATAIYRPVIVVPGFYNVSVWFPQSSFNSSRAPWFVSSQSGSTNVLIDQTRNGGKWVQIAPTQYFAAGTNGFVSISNGTGEQPGRMVIADAVRFLGSGPPAPQIYAAGLANNQFQLPINVFTGLAFTVEASTNLIDWSVLAELVSTNSRMNFSDMITNQYNARFFRAVIH
jgi:uncharacterized repeat protein (TIGR02543 family)